MRICLIMDNPETPRHPIIAVALQALSARHTVRLLDILTLSGAQASALEAENEPADLYLLKSHAPQALELAHALELDGRLVVNSWSSSLACQDRAQMSEQMQAAHLPWPATRTFATLAEAVHDPLLSTSSAWPLIIKSRFSKRDDLVDKLHSKEQMEALLADWREEPIVLQEFIAGDGWDIKLWVIDQHVFAARRRTPLEPGASKEDFPISAAELPAVWRDLALEIGHTFKMPLYGVDLLITEKGPLIIDVNAFPGFRGVPGASEALVDLVERLLRSEETGA
jgi:ribosomal protein S6--L-glutamate ligase